MKKIILLTLLIVMLLTSFANAVITYDENFYRRRLSYVGTGNRARDPIYLFMAEIIADVEALTVDTEATTGLTLANDLTIENTTDNELQITENSEDIILTFSNNALAWSSGTGVLRWDYGTIVPRTDMLILDPVATAPDTNEGALYYDSDVDILYVRKSSGWVDCTASAGTTESLDTAYDNGIKIDADSGVVEIEVDQLSNNGALHLDCDDTNGLSCLLIENDATGTSAIGVDIDGQSGGRDIEGTGATWYVSGAGAGTFATLTTTTTIAAGSSITAGTSVTTGTGDYIMENAASMTNNTDT